MRKLQIWIASVFCAAGMLMAGEKAGNAELFPGKKNLPAEQPAKPVKSPWLTGDFKEAQALSAASKRPIFLLFTGTDWCGWCVRLENEVLSKKDFLDYAANKLVLFKSDFPAAALRDPAKDTHPELTRKYNVHGFPTVLLLDKDGKVLHKTGYRSGGPVEYCKYLDTVLKSGKEN